MKILKNYWWLLLVFVAITLVFIISYEGKIPTLESQNEKPLDILGRIFTKLIIVGALLDQFIAVFFPQDETDKEQRIQAQNALSITKEEEKLIHKEILSQRLQGSSATFQNLNTRLSTFQSNKQVAENTIAEIDTRRSSYVRKIAFAFGLIIAMTGITILSDFFNMTDNNVNHKILSYIDIIFTAAVLSGGTSGINQLIQIIKDSWKKS